MVIDRPVLACGSTFEVTADRNAANVVQVTFSSNDPDKTAFEIGRRLAIRWVCMLDWI